MTIVYIGLIRSVVFLFGCILGSFVGAASYRIPRGMSLIAPRSHCPDCGHVLGPSDLVPLLSFLHSRRCAYCGEPISWRYFLIEMTSGLSVLVAYVRHGLGLLFVLEITLVLWALLLAVIDIEHRRLPNVLTILGMALGVIFNTAWYLIRGAESAQYLSFLGCCEILAPKFSPLHSLAGIVTGGGILWLVALLSKGGMGGGDVKFLAAIGSFVGPGAALAVLFLSSLFGSIFGIALMIMGRWERRQAIPFGPFLTLATMVVLLAGS